MLRAVRDLTGNHDREVVMLGADWSLILFIAFPVRIMVNKILERRPRLIACLGQSASFSGGGAAVGSGGAGGVMGWGATGGVGCSVSWGGAGAGAGFTTGT